MKDYTKVSQAAWTQLAEYAIDRLGLFGPEVEKVLEEAGATDQLSKLREWTAKMKPVLQGK